MARASGYGTQNMSRFSGGATTAVVADLRYICHAGDTLASVAKTCRLSVPQLVSMNASQFPDGVEVADEEDKSLLYVGQALIVDPRCVASSLKPSVEGIELIDVRSDEGGANFANGYCWTPPPSAPSSPCISSPSSRSAPLPPMAWLPPPPSEVDDVDCATHIVTRGESLTTIACMHGVTEAALRSANREHFPVGVRSVLTPGLRLRLPAPSMGSIVAPDGFEVLCARAGETLSIIAARYGMTVDELRAVSRLPAFIAGRTPLAAGHPLVVRQRPVRRVVAQRGDTLLRVAARLGVGLEELREQNAVPQYLAGCTIVRPGQTFEVIDSDGTRTGAEHSSEQSRRQQPCTHTVAPGDTIRTITQEYGMTEQELRAMNRSCFPVGDVGRLPPGHVLAVRKL